MKRWLWIIAVLAVVVGTIRAQAPNPNPFDLGPGSGGATLKLPGATTTPMSPPSGLPAAIQNAWSQPGTPATTIPFKTPKALLPTNNNEINKQFEITSAAGPWVIFVMAYTGENAPQLAHNFVNELRTTYKVQQAYVFNYGAEEKQKELERVQALQKKQMDDLAKAGFTGAFLPMRIPITRVNEQTGVLIGGFKDRDDALKGLAIVKKWKAPDPQKVAMDITELGELETDKEGKVLPGFIPKKSGPVSRAYVNPFSKAFPARNPALKHDEENAKVSAEELKVMRKINEGEDFSLFKCKGKLTLVVKQFNTQFKIDGEARAPREWFDLSFIPRMKDGKKAEWQDNAAHNAHNLAEGFRKIGLPETYVLHTRFCSFVTVGAFDDPSDPRVATMQNHLVERFRQMAAKSDDFRKMEMLPRPVLMEVPH